jgi:hypothetical protein
MSFVSANHQTPVSVRKWVELQGISLSHYYKLRREGLGPDELEIGTGIGRGRKLITPESTVAWLTAMAERRSPAQRAPKEIFITESRRFLPGGVQGQLEFFVSTERRTREGRILNDIVSGPFTTLESAQAELAALTSGGAHG